jgi:hypothetical protein
LVVWIIVLLKGRRRFKPSAKAKRPPHFNGGGPASTANLSTAH